MAIHGEVHQPHGTLCTDCESDSRGTSRHKPESSFSNNQVSPAKESTERLPHGVEDGPVLHDAEQFVRRGHVVGDRLLRVAEESVWSPDLVHHAVVQPQDISGAFELESLVDPHLTKEHVHGVLLRQENNTLEGVYFSFKCRSLSCLTQTCHSPSHAALESLFHLQKKVRRDDEAMMDATHPR